MTALRDDIADAVDRFLHAPDNRDECTAEEYRDGLLSLADEILALVRARNEED